MRLCNCRNTCNVINHAIKFAVCGTLRFLTHGSKPHCRPTAEFRTCSVSTGGKHAFGESRQRWTRLTERRWNKNGRLLNSNVQFFHLPTLHSSKELESVTIHSRTSLYLCGWSKIKATTFLNWCKHPVEHQVGGKHCVAYHILCVPQSHKEWPTAGCHKKRLQSLTLLKT